MLELLRCPITQSRLVPASNDVVQWINESAKAGRLSSLDGEPINVAIEGALLNEQRTMAMPIRSGVVSLTASRAISIEGLPQELS